MDVVVRVLRDAAAAARVELDRCQEEGPDDDEEGDVGEHGATVRPGGAAVRDAPHTLRVVIYTPRAAGRGADVAIGSRHRRRAPLATFAVLLAVVAGCGGEDPHLTGAEASRLTEAIDQVRSATSARGAVAAGARLRATFDELDGAGAFEPGEREAVRTELRRLTTGLDRRRAAARAKARADAARRRAREQQREAAELAAQQAAAAQAAAAQAAAAQAATAERGKAERRERKQDERPQESGGHRWRDPKDKAGGKPRGGGRRKPDGGGRARWDDGDGDDGDD